MARIVVTRPAGRELELLRALREAGHDALHVPLIAIEPLGDDPVDVETYDWVVVTSVVGARELRRRMRGTPRRMAAIGPATAAALGGADVVAEPSTQEGLLAALPSDPGRVLFAGAEAARHVLPDALGADVVALYRTAPLVPSEWPPCDLVLLASPSAARAYATLGRETPAVSIGPETSRAASAAGVAVVAEAATTDITGLLGAVRRALDTP
jgi:uroporphyrinogen-III synthase